MLTSLWQEFEIRIILVPVFIFNLIDVTVDNKFFGLLISCGLIYALVVIFCQALG